MILAQKYIINIILDSSKEQLHGMNMKALNEYMLSGIIHVCDLWNFKNIF